jgi:hypothetical protein
MRVGHCHSCGYSPIASGVPACPRCLERDPNPPTIRLAVASAGLLGLVVVVASQLVAAIGGPHLPRLVLELLANVG